MNQGLPPDSGAARLAQTKLESGFNIRREKQLSECRCGAVSFAFILIRLPNGTALSAEGSGAIKDPAAVRLGTWVVPTAGAKTGAEQKPGLLRAGPDPYSVAKETEAEGKAGTSLA